MEHPADIPGLFAFNFAGNIVRIEPRVRSTDYGISASSPSLSQALDLHLLKVVVWGVPADPSHDPDRFIGDSADAINLQGNRPSTPSPALPLPFLTNPTSCEATPSSFVAEADSWQDPGVFSRISFDSDFDGTQFLWKGCERVPFHPAITVHAGTHRAASPSGLDVDIEVPQSEDPYGRATAHVRKIVTVFPEGSIYGFARAITPLLDKPLEGPVYLRSSDNLLPDLVATLNGQFDIELAGRIDSVNGGIRNSFDVVPDAPVTKFVLKMKGGEKSLLVNSRNLCKAPSRAAVNMIGQNGKRHNFRPLVQNSCGKKSAKAKPKHRRHR
jgi:hypothetical protein